MRFISILILSIAFLAISETAGINKSSQTVSRIKQPQKPQKHFAPSKKILTQSPAQKVPRTKPAPRRIFSDYAFLLGASATISGNPVTYSAHPDSIIVRLDGNDPYIDTNNNGIFDQDTEWGWDHGVNDLSKVLLSDPIPLVPPCPGLQYDGKVHANGSLEITGNPHFNGRGSATGEIFQAGGTPFVNSENHYFRPDYVNYADTIPFPSVPTNREYWEERADDDTSIHIITDENVDLFPGWTSDDEIEEVPVFVWEGTEPIPSTTYFLTGHVRIEGNPTGNAYIITDHSIMIGGIPTDFEAGDQIKYFAGGDITVGGNQYIQGVIYSRGGIKSTGMAYIFGAVLGREGGLDGHFIVIASKVSLPITEFVAFDIKPQSCPNPLNIKNRGVLPAAILGAFNFDVSTLDTSSLRLNGVSPIRSNTEDVATPVPEGSDPCNCTGEGPDGYPDLTLKFRTQDIVDAIGEVEDGDTVVLTLTGELIDGTPIDGRDCIVILEKGKEKAITSKISPKLKVFSLFQNNPNPFTQQTSIQFQVPNKSHVHLDLFDVTGRLVKSLVNEKLESGIHQSKWDGKDKYGKRISSGIYFYRLTASEKTATRKMILLN
jgi:hypothetical protein